MRDGNYNKDKLVYNLFAKIIGEDTIQNLFKKFIQNEMNLTALEKGLP